MFKGFFTGILGGIGTDIDMVLGTGAYQKVFKVKFGSDPYPKYFHSEEEARRAFRQQNQFQEPQVISSSPFEKEWK